MASDAQTMATTRGTGRAGFRRAAPADGRAAGAGPRHHPAGRRRGPRHGLSRRRRRGRRCGPEHLDRPVATRSRACPRVPGRAGTPPARDGRTGRRGAFAAGHARLPSALAAGRSSRLRRPQGRHRRRRGDAGARPPLGTAQRPRPLVSGQPPGRHRPAGRGEDDRPRAGAVQRLAAGGGAGHSRRDVGGHRPDLRRAAANAAGRPPADRLGRAAHAHPVDGGELRGDAGRQPGAAGASRAGRGSCSRSSSSASRCRPWSWGPNVFQGHSPEWRAAWSAVRPWPCRPSCGRRPAAAASGTRSTCWRGCSCPARATWKGRSWGVSMRNGSSRPAPCTPSCPSASGSCSPW